MGTAPGLLRGPAAAHLPDRPSQLVHPEELHHLRIATVNLAHGRGHRGHQMFTNDAAREANLALIAKRLADENVHLVAAQEVDGRSWWAGNRDMAADLARLLHWDQWVRSSHVVGCGLDYGNALLSRYLLVDGTAVTWPTGWGSPPKGAVAARMPTGGRDLIVVSLHLDPAFIIRRRRQARALIEWLQPMRADLLLMGDFNAGWRRKKDAVRMLCEGLELAPWPQPELTPPTFGSNRSIDWILASSRLALSPPEVHADVPSDHSLVISDLRWRVPIDRI